MGNSANPLPPGLTEEEAEELHTELTKVTPGVYTVDSGSQHDSEHRGQFSLDPAVNERKRPFMFLTT